MTRKRVYDEKQKAVLRRLEILHEEKIQARKELRRKIEEEFEARLQEFEYRESRLMNEALRTINSRGLGIAKTDIGRAVGLANWDLLREKYALTEHEFAGAKIRPTDFGPFSATFRVLHDNDTVAEREGGPADWYFKAHISQYRDWNLSLWLGMGMFNRFGWWVDDKREAWQDIPDDFRSQVLDEDGVLHAEFVDWLKTEVFPVFTKATQ